MGHTVRTIARRLGAAFGVSVLALTAALVGVDRAQEHGHVPADLFAYGSAAVATMVQPEVASEAGWDISNLDHERVDYWVKRFQTDKRIDLETYRARKGRYQPLISEALAAREMPQDLVYLAMIESGFDPKAYSHAHASGLWQFIRGTASRYGLDINRAVDERNDPVKATDAALEYLSDLHRRFGSWYLAAAGYNSGENRITRILRAALGRSKGTDEDYYRIWNRLPRETRDYVPLMVAAARIDKDPVRYGFGPVKEALAPWAFEEVVARPATSLAVLARQAGTSVKDLKALNPHLKLDRTRNDQSMVVRVPAPSEPVRAD